MKKMKIMRKRKKIKKRNKMMKRERRTIEKEIKVRRLSIKLETRTHLPLILRGPLLLAKLAISMR